ncbi:type IVB secretion system protein IcmH/DotU [Thalassospira marina]|nr:type IVB secretion system protein IcmH/DotU [Thalassospira marina]
MTDIAVSPYDSRRSAALAANGHGGQATRQIGSKPDDMIESLMSSRETMDFQLSAKGKNRLLEAAVPLLGLSVRIRNLHDFNDIEALHSRLVNEIPVFQQDLEKMEYDEATVLAARYILCATLDEAVLSQVWGAESLWPERPMLSIFHNETWGGEKVFAILDRVMDEAHRFLDLLELLYYCIALGFEGKYHVMHNGQAKLEQLLVNVHGILEKHRGEAPDKLVNPEPNIYDAKERMGWRFPVWGVVLVCLVILAGINIAFNENLSSQIDGIEAQIEASLGGNNMAGRP